MTIKVTTRGRDHFLFPHVTQERLDAWLAGRVIDGDAFHGGSETHRRIVPMLAVDCISVY